MLTAPSHHLAWLCRYLFFFSSPFLPIPPTQPSPAQSIRPPTSTHTQPNDPTTSVHKSPGKSLNPLRHGRNATGDSCDSSVRLFLQSRNIERTCELVAIIHYQEKEKVSLVPVHHSILEVASCPCRFLPAALPPLAFRACSHTKFGSRLWRCKCQSCGLFPGEHHKILHHPGSLPIS